MIDCDQERAALEELYTLIQTHLRDTEPNNSFLKSTVELLCRIARDCDDVLPLALLPVWSYGAVRGHDQQRAIPVAAAWRCLHLAGKLLNDAAYSHCCELLPGRSSVDLLNTGVGLIFVVQSILSKATTDGILPTVVLTLHNEFSRVGLQATSGQHLKLFANGSQSWAHYQTVVSLRSGEPFALATRAGALLRQGDPDNRGESAVILPARIQSLAHYGYRLGLMLQLADDLNGVWRPKGQSDLVSGRLSWPLLYAEKLADACQRTRLAALLPRVTDDPGAETEVKALMVELGVPLAMAVASEEHRCRAEAALDGLEKSAARRALIALARRISLVPQREIR